MTDTQNSLICILVGNLYGNISELVVKKLSKCDCATLVEVASFCRESDKKIKIDIVKKAVSVLLFHNVITACYKDRKTIVYALEHRNAYASIRFSRFTCLINQSFGEIAEILIEELLLWGRATVSELVLKTAERIKETAEETEDVEQVDIAKIGQTFRVLLVSQQVIERAPLSLVKVLPGMEDPNCPGMEAASAHEKQRFQLPSDHDEVIASLRREWLQKEARTAAEEDPNEAEPSSKRRKLDPDAPLEPRFRVNLDRLEALWRDEIFVHRAQERTEAMCAAVLRHMLVRARSSKPDYRVEWDVSSPAVSEVDLKRGLPSELQQLPITHIDQSIRLLCEDAGAFLSKLEVSAGGAMLVCPYQRAWDFLTVEYIESVVQERFGSQAKRIFRFILTQGYVSLAHIEEKMMLNSSACRQYVYRLQDANFVKKVELSKSTDFSTTAAVYLYTVEPVAVVRMLLQWSYHALRRLIVSKETQLISNKRLFDKQLRADALMASTDEQIAALEDSAEEGAAEMLEQLRDQREEILKAFTPNEQNQLDRAQKAVQKLSTAELELDEQIFILGRYLNFQDSKTAVK